MSDTFERLPELKKQRILDACIREFASYGYTAASTNRIIIEAGISKGTLFNYFGNKKQLYYYIVDYAIQEFKDQYNKASSAYSDDLFERLKQRGFTKLKVAIDSPLIYEIIYKTFVSLSGEMKQEVMEKYQGLQGEAGQNMLAGLNLDLFRDDVDVKKVVEIVQIFLEGFFNLSSE